jgi:hypothetical protein
VVHVEKASGVATPRWFETLMPGTVANRPIFLWDQDAVCPNRTSVSDDTLCDWLRSDFPGPTDDELEAYNRNPDNLNKMLSKSIFTDFASFKDAMMICRNTFGWDYAYVAAVFHSIGPGLANGDNGCYPCSAVEIMHLAEGGRPYRGPTSRALFF